MYAYGHYSVVEERDGRAITRSFDSMADVNYHTDIDVIVGALCGLADQIHNTTESETPARGEREIQLQGWLYLKKTMVANKHMPLQQLAAPNGRIFWWLKLV